MRRNLIALFLLCAAYGMQAQKLTDVQKQGSPLVLQSQGSFYVGGKSELQTKEELGGICPDGHVAVNQMYVRYMVPQSSLGNTSFVLIHGMHLTGKCWETTPDGRMGWDEYLVRKGVRYMWLIRLESVVRGLIRRFIMPPSMARHLQAHRVPSAERLMRTLG